MFYLRLHHGWSLCAQHFDRLEDVHSSLVTHPLQHDTERDEHACPSHARTEWEKRDERSEKEQATEMHSVCAVWVNKQIRRMRYEQIKEVEEKVDSSPINHSYLIN